MTFFKTTFLSKYWIRSSQIAGFCPNNTKIFLGGANSPISYRSTMWTDISRASGILKGLVDQKFYWPKEIFFLKSTPVDAGNMSKKN